MKRIVIILVLFVAAQNWTYVLAWGVDYDPQRSGEVVLLSMAGCGYCARTRQFLNRAGVPFRELDIERNAEGQRRLNASGAAGVPVLQVGDRTVYGYDPRAIRTALQNGRLKSRTPDPESS